MTPEEMDQFSVKLENWSGTLSTNERALLKFMLEQGWGRQSSPSDFQRVTFQKPFTVEGHVPKLDANFFKIMCW
jgi:hypothetical protein